MKDTMDWIYSQLEQFVHSSKNLLALVPKKKEFEVVEQYFPLRFEANIIVSDKATYYFMVSENGGFIRHGLRALSLISLKADYSTWLQILNGSKSLMQEYNRGHVTMSNARANFIYKLALLSVLFESRSRIVRAGRILKVFPLSFLRAFLLNLLNNTSTILNRIPASVKQSFITIAGRLSNRLEK